MERESVISALSGECRTGLLTISYKADYKVETEFI